MEFLCGPCALGLNFTLGEDIIVAAIHESGDGLVAQEQKPFCGLVNRDMVCCNN